MQGKHGKLELQHAPARQSRTCWRGSSARCPPAKKREAQLSSERRILITEEGPQGLAGRRSSPRSDAHAYINHQTYSFDQVPHARPTKICDASSIGTAAHAYVHCGIR